MSLGAGLEARPPTLAPLVDGLTGEGDGATCETALSRLLLTGLAVETIPCCGDGPLEEDRAGEGGGRLGAGDLDIDLIAEALFTRFEFCGGSDPSRAALSWVCLFPGSAVDGFLPLEAVVYDRTLGLGLGWRERTDPVGDALRWLLADGAGDRLEDAVFFLFIFSMAAIRGNIGSTLTLCSFTPGGAGPSANPKPPLDGNALLFGE